MNRSHATLGLVLTAALLLSGCGVEGSEEGAPGNIAPYVILDGEFSIDTSSELTGSGTVRMSQLLGGLRSSESFHLRMDLLEDGSSVTLVAHGSASNLDPGQGIQVTFERTGVNSLDITAYSSNSVPYRAQPTQIATYRVDRLEVIVDILVDASGARVLIWRDTVFDFNALASDVDTEDYPNKIQQPGPLFMTGGLNWGLRLTNATVYLAQMNEARLN